MNLMDSSQRHLHELTPVQREHYEVARSFPREFRARDFKELYLQWYPDRAPGSILPSDFAYNNEQVAKDRFPWFLERVDQGVYRFIGLIRYP